MPHLRCTALAILCLALALIRAMALGQDYPSKPVRIVVPTLPGGGADLFARQIAPKLATSLGQQIVIDNRGGAGGNIGTELVAKAMPDGYTLLLIALSHAINPALYSKLQYDPVNDFVPVTQVTRQAYILVVHPTVPARTVQELIALSKAKPRTLNYSSGGNGAAAHLAGELFRSMSGADLVQIGRAHV